MAKIYADLIRKKAINPKTKKAYTLEDVPAKNREQVAELLAEA